MRVVVVVVASRVFASSDRARAEMPTRGGSAPRVRVIVRDVSVVLGAIETNDDVMMRMRGCA